MFPKQRIVHFQLIDSPVTYRPMPPPEPPRRKNVGRQLSHCRPTSPPSRGPATVRAKTLCFRVSDCQECLFILPRAALRYARRSSSSSSLCRVFFYQGRVGFHMWLVLLTPSTPHMCLFKLTNLSLCTYVFSMHYLYG